MLVCFPISTLHVAAAWRYSMLLQLKSELFYNMTEIFICRLSPRL